MPTGNTTLLGLALPVEGELGGEWGDVVNQSITELLDSAVAGTTTLSTDADVTLTTTVLAANQARQAILRWTASNGATTRNITAPAQSKPYIVINAGTGSIVLRGAGPTTGITVVAGERCLAAWDGSDFVKVSTSVASGVTTFSAGTTGLTPSTGTSGAVTLAGTLNVANGGTGATTLTANNVLLGNGTSALQVVAPGTNGNVLTSNGTTWQSVTPTAGVSLSADNTWTGTQTFSGTSAKLAVVLNDAAEVVTVSATAATGTIPYDVTTQSVLFYTTSASANWTVNFRASSGTSLNTALATGQSVTAAFLVTQGATAYFNSAVQVDGTTSGVTTRWQGGTAPTAGNASGVDVYVYTIIKTGSATFSVFASQTRFA